MCRCLRSTVPLINTCLVLCSYNASIGAFTLGLSFDVNIDVIFPCDKCLHFLRLAIEVTALTIGVIPPPRGGSFTPIAQLLRLVPFAGRANVNTSAGAQLKEASWLNILSPSLHGSFWRIFIVANSSTVSPIS